MYANSTTWLALDFETTNLDKGSALNKDNRLILACWIYRGVRKSTRHDYSILDLYADLGTCSFIVAHNAKFEIHWLRKLGYDDDLLVYDTMLAEYVWSGNRKVPLALDDLGKKYGGQGKIAAVSDLIDSGVCPSTIPIADLEAYCFRDVEETINVFEKQRVILAEMGLLPTLYTRCLVTPVLAAMERRGVALDRTKILEEYTEYAARLAELTRDLTDFTGGINLNSPKQLAIYLYETLGFAELRAHGGKVLRNPPSKLHPEGSRLTDAETILKLKSTTAAQRSFVSLFKDYGSLKVNTKALEKLWECCCSYSLDEVPILYAQYNQAVTSTHRLSSSGSKYKLQFQNFNRKFKPLFTARSDGWYVGEADGAQLEFRVAAHLGRDEAAARDIRDPKFDAHYQTAEALLGRGRETISKDERTDAKPDTFRPLYGSSSGTKEQLRYLEFFQKKYKGIYNTQTAWTHKVCNEKKLVTETGLIFYWPNCKMNKYGYISDRTSIFNYPVQSLATADIIPINLVFAYYRMRALGLRSFLVNTVHDAVIGEIHPDEVEQFKDIMKQAFTEDAFVYLKQVYNITFTVPLGCEMKVGTHWGVGEESKYNLDPEELFWLDAV